MAEQWNRFRSGEIMNGYQLTFYTLQNYKHEHRPMHQWLMELAKSMNVQGATVLMAQEGIGAHHRMHSAHFFELTDQPVEVVMVVSEEDCEALLQRLRSEPELRIFYSRVPIEFGTIETGV